MSESQSVGLTMLSKEDFKNLAKQAEKAKRDQNAKQAKINTPFEPSLPSSVHFDAPVKVSDDRDDKLLGVLGRYEDMSSLIMKQDKYFVDMVGVERQPTTPLPRRGASRDSFFNNPGSTSRSSAYPQNNASVRHSSSRPKSSANESSAHKNDVRHKQVTSSSSADKTKHGLSSHSVGHSSSVGNSSMKPPSSTEKLESRSNTQISNTTHKDSAISDQKPVQTSFHNKPESEKSHDQSGKKDSVSQSVRHPPVTCREPVLDSLKQELICQSAKSSVLQETSSDKSYKSSKPGASNTEKVERSPLLAEGRSVLQVKEENRNGAVVNGAKLKNKPKLHINVEDMLQEFQLPQPLTGIQTPFKESRFPWQSKNDDRNNVGSSQSNTEPCLMLSRRVPPEPHIKVIEEIQEKDTSSDSDSESGSGSDDDGESGDSEGDHEKDDKHDGIDLDEMINNPESVNKDSIMPEKRLPETREHRGRTVLAQKVPPIGTESLTQPPKDTQSARMDHSCSSSESSGSSSESGSDSGSDSESDKDVSDDEPLHHTSEGTPSKLKQPSEDLESSASPASKKWDLKSFLQQPVHFIEKKPPSCEAPPSDKSEQDHDDEVPDMKRGADHISDENPPSNDQEIKPMSGDEFSPPASFDSKHVLSPIKTPPPVQMKSPVPAVKSPMKHSFHRNKAAEKFYKSPRTEPEVNSSLAASTDSNRNQLTSPVKPSPDVKKVHRGRKSKQKFVSPAQVDSSDSEMESEIDVVHCSSESALDSPQKPLPVSVQNSQAYGSLDSSKCSNKPSTSSAKRKESKRDKLNKDKDLVKLKTSESSMSRKSSCDSSKKTTPSRSFIDPIEDMLQTFPGEKPVSPIPNVPKKQELFDQSRRVGLAAVRRIPTVLVKLDLNLLGKVLCVDPGSRDFLKPKPEYSRKHQKLTSAKNLLPSESKPRKLIAETVQDSLSAPSLQSANTTEDIKNIKFKSEKHGLSNASLTAGGGVSRSQASNITDFDSLPVKPESLSDHSVSSSSSDSESENESSKAKIFNSMSSKSAISQSPSPSEKRKRKRDTSRDDDLKRRKTLSQSPVKHSTPDPVRSDTLADVGSLGKRERHNSTSSQHSIQSNVSQRSTQSQRSVHSQRGHKRARTQEEVTNKTLKPSSSTSSLGVIGSKSTAVVTPVIKNEVRSEPVDMSRMNGFAAEPIMHHPMAVSLHQSLLYDREEEKRMLSADEYHRQAKKYKYQADDMEPCLTKYVLYLESVLCFIQCGYAMEKQHMITEASNMYKDTYKFVSHQYHQFRMLHDAESSDKAQKLTVLCLRIQSLIYLKLYMLKKNETVKLKRILEDNSKTIKSSSQQPKAPSAPSPHQPSWNRSTGTPSPMSPTPSPANSVCSVGSGGSDITPSKLSNGTSGQTQIVQPGSVIVSQRIHSITQKYFSNTCYLIQAHELWDQASSHTARDSREYFAQLDLDCGPLTFHSSLPHLVRYVRQGITRLNL